MGICMALDFALFGYYPQDRGFIGTMILIQCNDAFLFAPPLHPLQTVRKLSISNEYWLFYSLIF